MTVTLVRVMSLGTLVKYFPRQRNQVISLFFGILGDFFGFLGEIFSKAEKSGSCGLVTLECRDRGSRPVLYWKLLGNLFLNYFPPK